MTVETTAFLSGTKITSNGSEKSAKILKNNKNVIILLLAVILLLFCVSASVLQMWMFNKMNSMQTEIDELTETVQILGGQISDHQAKSAVQQEKLVDVQRMLSQMKKLLFDDDLLDDLDDFDKGYNQNNGKEEIDLDSESDGKMRFDDVGEDDEDDDEESFETDDDEDYPSNHSGYGETYDDEDEDGLFDSQEDTVAEGKKEERKSADDDDNNIYKDMTRTRKSRSISGVTNQGVPIIEEPYALRRNRSRVPVVASTPSHVANEQNPKLRLTWDNSRRQHGGPRRALHERNLNREQHHTRHHHSQQDSRQRFAFAAAPVYHSFENYGKRFNETATSTNPAPIQSRRSRVMHIEDKSKAFRQVVRKDQLARLQEMRSLPEQFQPANPHSQRPRMSKMRKNLELKNGKRMRITAVHYEGDSSSLVMGRHQDYQGNNKVKLSSKEYIHWLPAAWTNTHGMDRFFNMDSNGVLTVHDQGLFLIYAQVYYSDDHDVNGYVIELNNRAHYQCTTMTHTTSRVTKVNSCYTSGLIHLQTGDKIQLRDIGNHRSVMLEPSKSFFGLIKINLHPASVESSDVESFSNAEK